MVKMVTKPQLSHFFEIDITEYIETVKLRRNTKTFKQNDNNIVTIFATKPWQFFNNKKTKFWAGFPSKISKSRRPSSTASSTRRQHPSLSAPPPRRASSSIGPMDLPCTPPSSAPLPSAICLGPRPRCPLPFASYHASSSSFAIGHIALGRLPTPCGPSASSAVSPAIILPRLYLG